MRGVIGSALIVVLALSLGGCVRTRIYLADRERVDQELPAGAEAQYPDRATTRKVVVLEIVEQPRVDKQLETLEATSRARGSASAEAPEAGMTGGAEAHIVHESQLLRAPGDPLPAPAAAPLPAEYKVEKDDTLQKIAKKLYGSYGAWIKIWDANKDVLPNPNALKPGTVLKIVE